MLNELLSIERGLTAAGIAIEPRHPDIKSVGKGTMIRVRLDKSGVPGSLDLIDAQAARNLWTLRDAKQNSFPFVKINKPLLAPPATSDWRNSFEKSWKQLARLTQRQELTDCYKSFGLNASWIDAWPEPSLRNRLRERRAVLDGLCNTEAAAVPAVIDRFLSACERPKELFVVIARLLLLEIEEGAEAWIDEAKRVFFDAGRLYFDVARHEFPHDVSDPININAISASLIAEGGDRPVGRCAFTGELARLFTGSFHEPLLPVLGETRLFSRNEDIPAAHRYGRHGANSLDISEPLVWRLDAAVRALTADEREGVAWRKIPSEVPKESDLLLAFVEAAPDAPVADMLGGDSEDANESEDGEREAKFAMCTKRVIDAVQANRNDDFRKTPVQICILRSVDTANRKAVYHRRLTVDALYRAATAWSEGLDNLPPWLRLPAPIKGIVRRRRPPDVAPLQVPGLTRRYFNRAGAEKKPKESIGGQKKRETTGVRAQEVMAIFLGEADKRQLRSAISTILQRCGGLFSGSAHSLRRKSAAPSHMLEWPKSAPTYDHWVALRLLAVLGVLLHKLGHRRESNMSDHAASAAFRLGQILAVVDTVHVAYCVDVRQGQVPPTLLGNSVLAMAQASPRKALAVLLRRWRPYDSWAKRAPFGALKKVRAKPNAEWDQNDWAIARGESQARRMSTLGHDLEGHLPDRTGGDETFRAELFLGYVAGLAPRERSDAVRSDQEESHEP